MPKKNVLVFGTFDHLHPGHEFVFLQAMKRGQVTVIVARDENVKRFKGRPPMQSQEDRMQSIRQYAPACTVVLGSDRDFLEPVRTMKPDLILLGYDQKLPPGVTEEDLEPTAIERLPAYKPEHFKSTLLRKTKGSTMFR